MQRRPLQGLLGTAPPPTPLQGWRQTPRRRLRLPLKTRRKRCLVSFAWCLMSIYQKEAREACYLPTIGLCSAAAPRPVTFAIGCARHMEWVAARLELACKVLACCLADATAAVRGALVAAGGAAAESADGVLQNADLAGLALARLAAWRDRSQEAAKYQVRC